jgi:hypothetical protein
LGANFGLSECDIRPFLCPISSGNGTRRIFRADKWIQNYPLTTSNSFPSPAYAYMGTCIVCIHNKQVIETNTIVSFTQMYGFCYVFFCYFVSTCLNSVTSALYFLWGGFDHVGFINIEPLKVHKNENFFGSDFEFCTISLLVMFKY